MLDCQLYGPDPKGHHFNNILLHIAGVLLLFLSLNAMTGQPWKSAAVAAISLHPLNVESVAWVANRKGVLSTFFWMLALWGYARYAKSPRVRTYIVVIIAFVFGLLSKPTIVTLPFALLLLDYWPLGRLRIGKFGLTNDNPNPFRRAGIFNLVAEKIPLLALSAATVLIIYLSSLHKGIVVARRDLAPESQISECCDLVRQIPIQNDLALRTGGVLPVSQRLPFLATCRGGSIAPLYDLLRYMENQTGALPGSGVVLVLGDPRSGHRSGPTRLVACFCRPIRLHPPNRSFHNGRLGCF